MCELGVEILTFTDQEKSCLYYYFDSEAILQTFELIVIVNLKTLSVSVRCMCHLNKIYYYYYYLHLHRGCKLSLCELS